MSGSIFLVQDSEVLADTEGLYDRTDSSYTSQNIGAA